MNPAASSLLEERATFWRTLQTFALTRVVIAVVLLGYLSLSAKKNVWNEPHSLYWEFGGGYLGLALIFVVAALYWRRRFMLQLVAQIGVDITAISLLYFASGGVKSGLAILYLFPLAGGAVLSSLLFSMFFAAMVSLIMLAENSYQFISASSEASSSQVGLTGAAFFIITFGLNRLAAKLIMQEALTIRHRGALRMQQAINQLVIADMGDGILVVGPDGAVLTGNPAAERMLGLALIDDQTGLKLSEVPALGPIADAFFTWRERTADSPAEIFVVIRPGEDGGRRELATHLRVRFAQVGADGIPEDRAIVFLQDVTEIENQAQQLKLASMGRLTASIAHEVRNPLSAISYAASLLKEEVVNGSQVRLLNIVNDNVARLNRMIEDILRLSRKAQVMQPVPLAPLLAEVLAELGESGPMRPGQVAVGELEPYRVPFDAMHLREVLLNLLSNALRYASGKSGSIRIHIVSGASGRLELHVQDDGPPISAAVRSHLFEPFYTTSNKGTGLGLYLARELCLNNGAVLDYQILNEGADAWDKPGGRFVITFAAASQQVESREANILS